jgi:probable selenium-dependent hydroxylase accessory protein YqeC
MSRSRRGKSIVPNKEDIHLFSELFAFQPHSLVNFVGGGGKTGLIYKLMEEYCSQGPVLFTTTTRIHPPDASQEVVVLSSDNLPLLKLMIHRIGGDCAGRPYKIAVTRSFMSPNLLRGLPPDFNNTLDRSLFPIFLNEGDGAASFSIKLPRKGEPVLMENAGYLVPMIGFDCLNLPLGPAVLFRFQAFAERFSLREGEPLTPELAARILMHRQGVCKDWKAGAEIIPFINKVDHAAQDAAARELAMLILKNGNFPVKRVLFGSVLKGRIDSISIP